MCKEHQNSNSSSPVSLANLLPIFAEQVKDSVDLLEADLSTLQTQCELVETILNSNLEILSQFISSLKLVCIK